MSHSEVQDPDEQVVEMDIVGTKQTIVQGATSTFSDIIKMMSCHLIEFANPHRGSSTSRTSVKLRSLLLLRLYTMFSSILQHPQQVRI